MVEEFLQEEFALSGNEYYHTESFDEVKLGYAHCKLKSTV